MLEISAIPAFKDNYIWLLTRGYRAVVVDPGDPAPVATRLRAQGLRLEAILITHHHADHQGGVAELAAEWNPEVFGPANESITGRTHPLSGGESIEILGQRLEVLAVPGHTLGHLAYVMPGAVFCGDTLFGGGCGRLFEGTPAQMVDSLGKLVGLPAGTQAYCAHEYTEANLRFAAAVEPDSEAVARRQQAVAQRRAAGASTVPLDLLEEQATNPFLRCQEPAVIKAAQQRDAAARDPVAVFAALRAWRNVY